MLFLVTLRALSIVRILVLYIFRAHIFLMGSLRVFSLGGQRLPLGCVTAVAAL